MHEKHTVKDWMMDLVVFVDPDQTVYEILSIMRRRYINSVMVRKSEADTDYGIVTSKDISDKIVAENRNPKEVLVKEVMSSPVVAAPQELSIKECAILMREKRIHHLPVKNDSGLIIGMVSASDFLLIAEGIGTNFQERSLS
ncbi:MAG TPA: CBS domain-containing protein [Anaerolineaceae bacterium]|nr:CBS domain-containing protein [Anaerolineaceae bacterium]